MESKASTALKDYNKKLNNFNILLFQCNENILSQTKRTTFLPRSKMVPAAFMTKAKKISSKEKRQPISIMFNHVIVGNQFSFYMPIFKSHYMNSKPQTFYPYFKNFDKSEHLINYWIVLEKESAYSDFAFLYKSFKLGTQFPLNDVVNLLKIDSLEILTTSLQKAKEILDPKKTVPDLQAHCLSVKSNEEMNEYHLSKTTKQFFCPRCFIFNCNIHGIFEEEQGLNFEVTNDLIDNLKFCNLLSQKISKYTPESTGNMHKITPKIPCSPDCYLNLSNNLTTESLKCNTFSKFDCALIKLGTKMYKYDLCKVALLNPQRYTCKLIFLNLLKNKDFDYTIINWCESFIKKMKNTTISSKGFLANYKAIQESTSKSQGSHYIPCHHQFSVDHCEDPTACCLSSSCPCSQRGFCDKYCGCISSVCKIMRKGCLCESNCSGRVCLCHSMGYDCDPDLCVNCFNTCGNGKKKNNCMNNMMYYQRRSRTIVGKSGVCDGLGLFSGEKIQKDNLVIEYKGEIIENDEAEKREKYDELDGALYLFNLTDEVVLDSKYKGNKARFINHSKKANCYPRPVFTRGDYHMGLYAKRDIEIGEELFFDYDGANLLKEKYTWISSRQPNLMKRNSETVESDCEIKNKKHFNLSKPLICNAPFEIELSIDATEIIFN